MTQIVIENGQKQSVMINAYIPINYNTTAKHDSTRSNCQLEVNNKSVLFLQKQETSMFVEVDLT